MVLNLLCLFRKGFNTARFRTKTRLLVSRLAVVKSKHQARLNVARADVVEFLNNENVDRALIRVEQVMREQNTMDLYAMLESYCSMLMDRINLIKQEKIIPEEIKEAVSSLIYAATRCGEIPELKKIRKMFASWYGTKFATSAIELRNNCGVNVKIVQKLSTRMPSLDERIKTLKQIASDNNLPLQIEDTTASDTTTVEHEALGLGIQDKPAPSVCNRETEENLSIIGRGRAFSGSTEITRKYKDVADAAEEAYESAAYAALAAKAALELSRPGPKDCGRNIKIGKILTGF